MSTYRSANTRQSQTQSQNQIYSTIQKRNPQFNAKQPQRPQTRQMQEPQYQKRRGTSVASSSVYDQDEVQPNIRLTIKQAITLITLRLGKLEVFMNDTKMGGFSKGDFEEGGKNVDKDFLLSIVSRLDNMEKLQHNLRIEVENLRKLSLEPTNLEEEPLIMDIFERLENLDVFAKQLQDSEETETQPEPVESSNEIEVTEPEQIENTIEPQYPVYNPSIIEPYQIEPPVEPVVEIPVPVEIKVEPILKTPRKRAGKKVSI